MTKEKSHRPDQDIPAGSIPDLHMETSPMEMQEMGSIQERIREIESSKRGRMGILFSICFLVLGFLLIWSFFDMRLTLSGIIVSVLGGILIALLSHTFWYGRLNMRENSLRNMMAEHEMNAIQVNMSQDVFENSIRMSSKFLNQYYKTVRIQAQNSFGAAVGVAIAGALIIGVGILLAFFNNLEVAVVSSVSGVITEMISAIFFALYNKTVANLDLFHDRLTSSQNVAIALKVADSLTGADAVQAKQLIIAQLMKETGGGMTDMPSANTQKKQDEKST